jgi:hypothetical protein
MIVILMFVCITINVLFLRRVVVTNDSITINKAYLERMPAEYARSLETLTSKINEELEKQKLPHDKLLLLQESANDLAKELTDIRPQQMEKIPFEKRNAIGSKLIKLGRAMARTSPTTARTVIGMTPLSPISALVGEGFDKIVEHALEEEGPQENK